MWTLSELSLRVVVVLLLLVLLPLPLLSLFVLRRLRRVRLVVVLLSVSLEPLAEAPEEPDPEPALSPEVSLPGPGWLPELLLSLPLLPVPAPAGDCANAAPLASTPENSRAIIVFFMGSFLSFVASVRSIFDLDVMSMGSPVIQMLYHRPGPGQRRSSPW